MNMTIQNDIHRYECTSGGWLLTRIVRVGGHTLKACVGWGYKEHQKEISSWVWTSVGWEEAISRNTGALQCPMKVGAITQYDMNSHSEPNPPDHLYDLYDKDADSLIDMTLAMLGGAQ